MTEHPEALVSELLELTGCERGAHADEILAQLRAEHGQVRLHDQRGRADRTEHDLLDAQLLSDLVRVDLSPWRALHEQPA